MHRHQRGVTLIGWIFLLAPLALAGYAGIRLVPIYLNYGKVAKAMSQVASEAKADDPGSVAAVRNSLEKRLDIEGIEFPDIKNFDIHRDGPSTLIDVGYEETAPLLYNVGLLVTFRKSVRIGNAPSTE